MASCYRAWVTNTRYRLAGVLVVLCMAVATGCGSDKKATKPADTPTKTSTGTTQQNACPVEGCDLRIVDVVRQGDELAVTWEANFAPDFARNHVHVFWDTFTAAQVSNNASEHGVEQGEWVPTGDDPTFVTEGAVSTSVRGDSTTVCVTAGDRDHNVIDSEIVDCRDVAALLG